MKLLNFHRDRLEPGRLPPGFVDITRRGPWGNPIALGRPCRECGRTHTRDDAADGLVCYGRWLIRRLQADERRELRDRMAKLERAEALVCVCAPALCHGDVLRAYIEMYSERLAIVGEGIVGLFGPWDTFAEVAHESAMLALQQYIEHLTELRAQLSLPGQN